MEQNLGEKTGVNICPTKSETVYQPIWGILKLSGVLNQKILKLSIWGIPYDPKLLITSKTVCQKCQFLKLSIRSKKCQATAFYSPLEKNPGV